MEDTLSAPLPLLPLSSDSRNVSPTSLHYPDTVTDSAPIPDPPICHQLTTSWAAAELIHRIDVDVLVYKIPRLAGQFCDIEKVPIIKSYTNLLLLLQERDTGKQWITRVPYFQEDAAFLINQVEPLIRVAKKFSFRVPYMYAYGLAGDPGNGLRVDFLLLDFIEGRQMPIWTEHFPSLVQKRQILEQMATVYLEMFSKPVTYEDRLVLPNANDVTRIRKDFDNFEIPPTMTASLYLYNHLDTVISAKLKNLLSYNTVELAASVGVGMGMGMNDRLSDLMTLFLMRAIVPDHVVGKHNDSPFYITHPDLHNQNIIITGKPVPDQRDLTTDEFWQLHQDSLPRSYSSTRSEPDEIKLAGIVDWDSAHPVPLQVAAIYPKFLQTLPGNEFPDLPNGYEPPEMLEEKRVFLQIFKKKESLTTGHTVVADLIERGSWDRDFFTVASRQKEVREKWLEWRRRNRTGYDGTLSHVGPNGLCTAEAKDVVAGLVGYLARSQNRDVIDANAGWRLVGWILLQLEQSESDMVEDCWFKGGRV